jgi:hypothetical protein
MALESLSPNRIPKEITWFLLSLSQLLQMCEERVMKRSRGR